MKSKIIIGGSIFIAFALIFVGRMYGSGSTAAGTAQRQLAHSSAPSQRIAKNQAPDFRLAKLGGGEISLSDFRGKKPVVLDFWASWCPNCRRDMPNLNRFYEKYKNDIEVVGINLQERESVIREFVDSRNISFPIALDPYKQASNSFGIQYTNSHILIDKNGDIVSVISGDIKESDILSLIQNNS